MVFEHCVPDIHLFCPCHRFLLYHHRRHGRLCLGLDHRYYYLAVAEVVGNFLDGQLPFPYLVLELKLIIYRD